MKVQNYRGLIAWQKAMALVKSIYQTTKGFPKDETYGLTSQIRRAAVSIPSNIAEGQGRNSTKEFIQFLSIAYGSLMEVETQIMIAESLEYLQTKDLEVFLEQTGEVARLINGLSKSLESKIN
jgi:four helix bundle protein